MIDEQISVLSRIFLAVPVKTNLEVMGNSDAVSVALVLHDTPVELADFHSAQWAEGPKSPEALVLIGPGGSPSIGEFTRDDFDVYVTVQDNPEVPVLLAGTVRFI